MSSRILFVFWIVVSPMCVTDAWAETAADYNKIFEQAVAAVDFDFHRSWAYTETRVDAEHSIAAIVEPGSIRLVEETDDYWLFGFNPDDEEDVMDSVDATIRVDKAHGHLDYIDLRNHEIIKPAFGVKISKLITRLTFAPAADGGPVVPVSTQVEATGRAYLVVSFDEQEVTRNSDFENVAEDLEMVPDR